MYGCEGVRLSVSVCEGGREAVRVSVCEGGKECVREGADECVCLCVCLWEGGRAAAAAAAGSVSRGLTSCPRLTLCSLKMEEVKTGLPLATAPPPP